MLKKDTCMRMTFFKLTTVILPIQYHVRTLSYDISSDSFDTGVRFRSGTIHKHLSK